MSYPQWICATCGDKYGNRPVDLACWHLDVCQLCGDETSVTQPRDYGHLREEPFIFKCVPQKEKPFTMTLPTLTARGLEAINFLEQHLTARGKGPIVTVTVRGLTFHRTPEGAYLRMESR